MATSFKSDAAHSQNWFVRFVVPALRHFGFTDIASTEARNSAAETLLDRGAGIDALARRRDGAIVALASRILEVKPYGGEYSCFSLRDSRFNGNTTEFEKLQRAIKMNSVRPMWHCQTFVDVEKGKATVALVRTKELVQFVADNPLFKDTKDGTKFRLAPWHDLSKAGVKYWTVTMDGEGKKITA